MTDTTLPAQVDGPRFSIGRTLAMSFGVLGRNFRPLALVSLVITAIQSVADFLISGDPTGGDGAASSIVATIAYALITAPVTYATFQDLRGMRVTSSEMMARGFARVLRVIFTSLVVGLVILIVLFASGLLAAFLLYAMIPVAGFVVLSIVMMWFVVVPVQVMENGSFSDAFGRAQVLGRGHRWGILGLVLVYGVLIAAFAAAVATLSTYGTGAPIAVLLFMIPLGAFYSVLGAILPAVTYYLLRAEKEGVGIEEIARVFD